MRNDQGTLTQSLLPLVLHTHTHSGDTQFFDNSVAVLHTSAYTNTDLFPRNAMLEHHALPSYQLPASVRQLPNSAIRGYAPLSFVSRAPVVLTPSPFHIPCTTLRYLRDMVVDPGTLMPEVYKDHHAALLLAEEIQMEKDIVTYVWSTVVVVVVVVVFAAIR